MSQSTLRGQAVFRRRLSKKLVFYDVAVEESAVVVELILKVGFLEPEAIKLLRDTIRLGDVVQATGVWQAESEFLAHAVHVVRRWHDEHPHQHFVPHASSARQHRAAGPPTLHPLRAAPPASGPPQLGAATQHPLVTPQSCTQPAPASTPQPAPSAAPALQHRSLQAPTGVAGASPPAAPGGLPAASRPPAAPEAGAAAPDTAPDPDDPLLGTCKYWVNTGACSRGALCPYAHPLHPERRRIRHRWESNRVQERKQWAEGAGFHQDNSAAGRRARAAVFADWLVATFGRQELVGVGAGVLDVAGGRGNVSFELAQRHHLGVLMVEPRPAKLSKAQRRILAKPSPATAALSHPPSPPPLVSESHPVRTPTTHSAASNAAAALLRHPSTPYPASPGPPAPPPGSAACPPASVSNSAAPGPAGAAGARETALQHVPAAAPNCSTSAAGSSSSSSPGGCAASSTHIGAGSGTAAGGAAVDGAAVESAHKEAAAASVACGRMPSGVVEGDGNEGAGVSSDAAFWQLPQLQEMFTPQLWQEGPHAALVRSCSVVVGMHPDQATEAILQFALECRKPFAIVPCCVFPRQFPGRRLRLGGGQEEAVQTYSQLVAYLVQQGGAQEAVLGFQGANRVVYRLAAPLEPPGEPRCDVPGALTGLPTTSSAGTAV